MPRLLTIFVILGCLVGGGVFVTARDIVSGIYSGGRDVHPLHSMALLPLWSGLSLPLSLPFGIIPALTSGAIYSLLLRRRGRQRLNLLIRAGLGSASGAASCAVFAALFTGISTPGQYTPSVNFWAWLIAGLVTGAVCALAAGIAEPAIRHHGHAP